MQITSDIFKKYIENKKIKWSSHALSRIQERNISVFDIKNSIVNGEIIEQYPNEYLYPSCLILGITKNEKSLHIVVGLGDDYLCIITAYFPDILI